MVVEYTGVFCECSSHSDDLLTLFCICRDSNALRGKKKFAWYFSSLQLCLPSQSLVESLTVMGHQNEKNMMNSCTNPPLLVAENKCDPLKENNKKSLILINSQQCIN